MTSAFFFNPDFSAHRVVYTFPW